MKLALFNGLPFHYEMYNYILDFCKEKGIQIDCYTNRHNDLGWLDYYSKTYDIVRWYNIMEFNPNNYDYIFLITDDDSNYNYFLNFASKTIVIEHSTSQRFTLTPHSFIQTRQFKLRSPPSDPNTWVMPLWNNRIYKKYDKLTVLSVGLSCRYAALEGIFSNFQDIDFILVDRNIDIHDTSCNNTEKNKNIKKYKALFAEKLIELASKAHYILFFMVKSLPDHHLHTILSASFPLGYSVGTPIITQKQLKDSLGFRGVIGIDEGSPIHLDKPTEQILNDIMIERQEFLERRDRIFTQMLFQKPT